MRYDWIAMNDDLYSLLRWQYEHRVKSSTLVFCHKDGSHSGYEGQECAERRDFVKRLCRKAGVEEFNFHDIRHSVACYLNHVQEVGMKGVQTLLRHKAQGITETHIGGGNCCDTREVMKLLEIDKLKRSIWNLRSFYADKARGVGQ